MMGIRWGNGIPSALRGTTAVYANGYAVRCVKPAVFPRRCSITLRHLPSDFSISTTDLFEAAYILGHHPIFFFNLFAEFFIHFCTFKSHHILLLVFNHHLAHRHRTFHDDGCREMRCAKVALCTLILLLLLKVKFY